MCGIFGAAFVSAIESVDARAALRTLHHRGPDASGVHTAAPGCVLGHTRLAILDLTEAGAQPMASADGQTVLTFNGEIYNHHALRRELVALGHTFRSRSDTEVIVEGYRAWGDRVIERIDGMFALGLYDVPRRRLLLARDRAGKKPLFYALDRAGGIRFASEIKALIAAGVRPEVDTQSLPSLLVFGYAEAPRTMHRGVLQLPPASTLVLESGGEPVVRRYWRAPFDAPALRTDAEEASRNVRRLVEQAVERRLEADVPLGAFLSGGVDSTVIVGVMSRLMGRKVKTFSIGFAGDAKFDETHYARMAARAFDTEHTEFVVKPSSVDLIGRLVELHDGPFGDSSAIPTSIVSMLTREHVTVALTGDGGDELFCGYTRFLAAEAAERMPALLRRGGRALARRMRSGPGERTLAARAHRFLSVAAQPLADRMVGWSACFPDAVGRLIRPDVRAGLDLDAPFAWSRGLIADNTSTTLARVLQHNFESYLPYDLLVKADRASMAHSLEVRSPFLDTALIEYAARLPDGLKRRGTNTKWVLKHAFRDVIPQEIQTRGKMGFGVPLGTWFRTDMRGYVLDHLAAPNARLYDYLDRAAVDEYTRAHFDGRADHGHRLWLLLTLEVWLRSRAQPAATGT